MPEWHITKSEPESDLWLKSQVHRYKKTSRGIDYMLCQAYDVCVIMAPCERCYGNGGND
jgi:hypothetical protein